MLWRKMQCKDKMDWKCAKSSTQINLTLQTPLMNGEWGFLNLALNGCDKTNDGDDFDVFFLIKGVRTSFF